jgi:hypothetical protein
MWHPFRDARERAERERAAYLDALHAIVETTVESARAIQAQADAFKAYLDLFKVQPQKGWVVTDSDQWLLEAQRRASGAGLVFPADDPPEAQAAWVMQHMQDLETEAGEL